MKKRYKFYILRFAVDDSKTKLNAKNFNINFFATYLLTTLSKIIKR